MEIVKSDDYEPVAAEFQFRLIEVLDDVLKRHKVPFQVRKEVCGDYASHSGVLALEVRQTERPGPASFGLDGRGRAPQRTPPCQWSSVGPGRGARGSGGNMRSRSLEEVRPKRGCDARAELRSHAVSWWSLTQNRG